jgi:lipopolysaccharide/colanic/teichoic acid biosynthesis glycosyltransferase
MLRAARRSVDLLASAIGLALLTPLLLSIAVFIFLDDGRPVLFRQRRVGRRGKLFSMLKFRTMAVRSPGSAITASGDSRITPIGRHLRRLKLDELPQLLNVVRGEMSLVGPRPEVAKFVRLEDPRWQRVLQVKPGITDLATLLYRNEEELLAEASDPEAFYREVVLPEKLRINAIYMDTRSWSRDFKLIALTLRCSLFPKTFKATSVAISFHLSTDDVNSPVSVAESGKAVVR